MVNENHCTAIHDSNTVNFGHSPTLPIDIMLGQLPLSDGEKNSAEYVKEVTLSLKSAYVTGYWKTDHNVTLGQLHFIGPANSHTHALSMH